MPRQLLVRPNRHSTFTPSDSPYDAAVLYKWMSLKFEYLIYCMVRARIHSNARICNVDSRSPDGTNSESIENITNDAQ